MVSQQITERLRTEGLSKAMLKGDADSGLHNRF